MYKNKIADKLLIQQYKLWTMLIICLNYVVINKISRYHFKFTNNNIILKHRICNICSKFLHRTCLSKNPSFWKSFPVVCGIKMTAISKQTDLVSSNLLQLCSFLKKPILKSCLYRDVNCCACVRHMRV